MNSSQRCNMGMVELEKVRETADQSLLHTLIESHTSNIPAAGKPKGLG